MASLRIAEVGVKAYLANGCRLPLVLSHLDLLMESADAVRVAVLLKAEALRLRQLSRDLVRDSRRPVSSVKRLR